MLRLALAVLVSTGCGSDPPPITDAGMDGGIVPLDAGFDAPSDAAVLVDAPPDARPSPGDVFVGPDVLSETGLYADLATGELADGVMPYRVRFELWADGATKERWLYLPPGTQIDTTDPDRWEFPIGTRAWKEFVAEGTRVETRLLLKVEPDRWENVAYLWRADGTDADAVPEGMADALGTTHDVPGIDGCWDCHRAAVDGLNGVGAIQLATGEADDLLVRLEMAGLLTVPITPAPAIPGNEVEQAGLGYLLGNCAHCHNEDHPLAAFREMRMRIPLGLTSPLDAPAVLTIVGAKMHHTVDGTRTGIVPGEPLMSQLYVRTQHRLDEWQMPPRATEVIDTDGSAAIEAFIEGLPVAAP